MREKKTISSWLTGVTKKADQLINACLEKLAEKLQQVDSHVDTSDSSLPEPKALIIDLNNNAKIIREIADENRYEAGPAQTPKTAH